MRKATRQQTRAHNKRLVLRTIYQQPETNRAAISRATGLTRTTVSDIVTELIDEGLIEETGIGPSAGGKPPVLLNVVAGSRNLIGVDLANSQFRGGVMDLRGKIIARMNVAVPQENGELALRKSAQLIDSLLAASQGPVLGIGIGTPGLIDAREGIVRRAVNLEWQDLPLRRLLQERYDLPVYVSNDSHAAALGEYTFGQARQIPNLIVIKVGRGTSAGIVLKGRLYTGDGSGAGEIGHVRVVDNGQTCSCGQTGCLETVASTRAIVQQARAAAMANPSSSLHQFVTSPEELTTDSVLQAYTAGSEEIKEMVISAGHYLGIAVAHLVGALNIHHIFIAGSMARFGRILADTIAQEMRQRAMPLLTAETEVALSNLDQDIVMLGAASHLLTNELMH
jgi:glucokinase-like ROK family protein